MKTAEEMCDLIVAEMKRRRSGVSFVELIEAVGKDAEGDLTWFVDDKSNIFWWAGLSLPFIEAMRMARSHMEMQITSFLVYACDGRIPRAPIAKKAIHYKEPHWIPVAFNWKDLEGVGPTAILRKGILA